MSANSDAATDRQVAYWQGELERAKKRFRTFWENGDQVVDAYRLQKADGNDALNKDKYNILYSSTETIRPNLYAQTPKPRVALRNKDLATDTARAAAMLLEGCLAYLQQEEDFDDIMSSAVEDYMLPGMGAGWVRYEATFGDMTDDKGAPVMQDDGKTQQQELLDEMVKIEYVYWQDFLCGVSRVWKDTPWVARRLWLNKDDAAKRFGKEKADQLTYATREHGGREMDAPTETAEAWEIWDKTTKTVYWYGQGLAELLDEKPDPLKLKNFFPCPRPLRAISNTRTFVPRALYSQYKSQAETLNVQTKRIRLLSEALRVVGMYDGSQPKLADVLNPTSGNRMIAVDSWATFAQNQGLTGSVVWLPIDAVVKTLNELLSAREICKQEIYEITGFSDITRGVSKASETLGAQNLKSDWAGARVKKMQAEVQRFARDLLALAGELVAEHCEPATIAMFSGLPIPDPTQVQQDPSLQAKVQTFKAACAMIRDEIRRVATIDIETDSTLLADDQAERDDRTKFLAAAGAFLQQAVPAMESTPELGPLLGAMLMFVVRTFPTSRPIEDEFEKVQTAMSARMNDPSQQDKNGTKAKIAADQAKAQLDAQNKQLELQIRQQHEAASTQNDTVAEQNRHQEKMLDLQLRQREIAIKEQQMAIDQQHQALDAEDVKTRKYTAIATAAIGAASVQADVQQAEQQQELDYDRLDDESAHKSADRAADVEVARTQAAAVAAQPPAPKPKKAPKAPPAA